MYTKWQNLVKHSTNTSFSLLPASFRRIWHAEKVISHILLSTIWTTTRSLTYERIEQSARAPASKTFLCHRLLIKKPLHWISSTTLTPPCTPGLVPPQLVPCTKTPLQLPLVFTTTLFVARCSSGSDPPPRGAASFRRKKTHCCRTQQIPTLGTLRLTGGLSIRGIRSRRNPAQN